ncbi:TPA: hypothetical protein MDR36_005282 [Klebsiella quasipneumoniae]|nr:hypothetical protein [Klebsiella quasipneumoniae]
MRDDSRGAGRQCYIRFGGAWIRSKGTVCSIFLLLVPITFDCFYVNLQQFRCAFLRHPLCFTFLHSLACCCPLNLFSRFLKVETVDGCTGKIIFLDVLSSS